MSYKIAAIGGMETVIGLGLGGVTHTHVHSQKEETLDKLKEFLSNPEIGLILITHRIAEEIGAELKRIMREKRPTQLILRIPDKTGYVTKADELREMIKRTVGAEIVLKES